MCRAAGSPGAPHGKRCNLSQHKRDAAQQRRRENRAIAQQINRWAKDAGRAEELAALQAARKPVNEVKEWAQRAGAPTSVYARAAGPAKKGWAARAEKVDAQVQPPSAAARAESRRYQPAPVARKKDPVSREQSPAERAEAARRSLEAQEREELTGQFGAEEAERIQRLRARQGSDEQEQQLLATHEAHENTSSYLGGVNDVKQLRYSDGTIGYFKGYDDIDSETAEAYGHDSPYLQPTHEVAASQFAQALGPRYGALVPPAVIAEYDGQWGSIAYGVPGRPVRTMAQLNKLNEHSSQASDLAFFDCLIGQVDRHGGNVLMDRRGISAIDHGFAFTDGVGGVNASLFAMARSKNSADAQLTNDERQVLNRFLDSDDGLGLRGTIQDDRFFEVRRRAKLMLTKGRVFALEELYR